MKSKLKLYAATIALAGAVGAGTAHAADNQSQIPTSGEKVAGAPFEVKRDWGTFKLADRIAAKVKAGDKINYVFSYQASGIPLFSPQFAAGFEHRLQDGQCDLSTGLRVNRAGAN